MELQNYERELKYLVILNEQELSFEKILHFLDTHDFRLVETRLKQKHEAYYDDENLSFIKKGDVIRSSTHINANGTYSHFMYKRNVSNSNKPYVSKFELGSGQFETVQEFIASLELNVNIQQSPVLYAEMERETAIVEKGQYKLLISYDKVSYYKNTNADSICERMLEIEDWTNPYSITDADDEFDAHLCEIHELILNDEGLPLQLTTHSKPFRGYIFFKERDCF